MASHGAAGIQRAPHIRYASGAAVHHDTAIALPQTTGLHHAIQVQHRVCKSGTRLGTYVGHATIGHQRAQCFQARVQGTGGHVEENQPIPFHIHTHRFGRCQTNARRFNAPVLRQLRGHQCHRATGLDGAAAFLGQAAGHCIATFHQLNTTIFHGLIANAQGGGHQRAQIQHGTTAKNNAVRVAEEDTPIGLQAAKYLRWIVAHHPVEQDGLRPRLLNFQAFATADGERPPVKPSSICALHNRHVAARGGHGGLPQGGGGVLRQGMAETLQAQHQDGRTDG